jgi:hypothetical protein
MRVYPVQFFAEDERSGFNWAFSLFNDDTLEPVFPEITASVMPFRIADLRTGKLSKLEQLKSKI